MTPRTTLGPVAAALLAGAAAAQQAPAPGGRPRRGW